MNFHTPKNDVDLGLSKPPTSNIAKPNLTPTKRHIPLTGALPIVPELLSAEAAAGRRKVARDLIIACAVIMPTLVVAGTFAFSGFGLAKNVVSAGIYLVQIAGILWLGVRASSFLGARINRHLEPSNILKQAKKDGILCVQCEYPVHNLDPFKDLKCPECGLALREQTPDNS